MKTRPSRRDVLVGAAQAALAAPFLTLTACGTEGEADALEHVRGHTMGTTYTLLLRRDRRRGDTLRVHARIARIFRRIDARMSVYQPRSELTAFNRSPTLDWVPVSEETRAVVACALAWSRASAGAFDPTVGPLVDLWGFGPARGPRRTPASERLAAVRAQVGHAAVATRVAPPALRRRRPGVRLDLSAIAQGYALDAAAAALDAQGVSDYLLEVGGEIRARGQRPDGAPWRVAIERPPVDGSDPLGVLALVGGGVATSGVYGNFFEEGGVRRSHVLDPRTGAPVAHGLLATTVVLSRSIDADAAATSLLVLGPEAAERFARERELAALWVEAADGGLRTTVTPALSRLLEGGRG